MKKAVIVAGGKQYLVAEGDILEVELLRQDGDTATFKPLLTIDGDKVNVGRPEVDGAKVTAEIQEADVQSDKVTSIRYKAKKRVHKTRGHRQRFSRIKVTKIA